MNRRIKKLTQFVLRAIKSSRSIIPETNPPMTEAVNIESILAPRLGNEKASFFNFTRSKSLIKKPIEEIVLVDEENNALGTMPKLEVHQKETLLHRGFSVFIFNKEKKLLLQQRSHKKRTWPLAWSNSLCGHPKPEESYIDAIKRRAKYELEIKLNNTEKVAPYRYKFSKDGVMENEICPIFVGFTKEKPKINEEEVSVIQWMRWNEFLDDIKNNPDKYSPWCIEQAKILNNNKRFKELLNL